MTFKLIYLFLAVLGLLLHRLSSGCSEWGLLSRCRAWASHWGGFSCCGAQAAGLQASVLWPPGSGAQTQQLWCLGLAVLWHVGSSWTRDWTHVTCIGRQILYHWATREALSRLLLKGRENNDMLHMKPGCLWTLRNTWTSDRLTWY